MKGETLLKRENVYDSIGTVVARAVREGPLGLCGDLNAHIHFRRPGEGDVFGRYIFLPQQIAPIFGDLTNRELLAQFCSRFDLAVMNTFLPKRPMQQQK